MTPSQALYLLKRVFVRRRPILLFGAPGVGKTDIVLQAAEACNFNVILSHPIVSDPTDAKGAPWPDVQKRRAILLPFGELADVLESTVPTVWFWDDFGQALPAVQAAYMQWLLARRVGPHVLPDCVTIAVATNRREDNAAVSGILEPVKSRFVTMVTVEPDLDDWIEWATANGIPSVVTSFLEYKPNLLFSFNPTRELKNSPSPRAWANLSELVLLELPPGVREEAYTGAVGEGAAIEFLAYEKVFASLVTARQVIQDPQNTPIPDNPSELYSLCEAIARLSNPETFSKIAVYLLRLCENQLGEYAVLTVKNCVKQHPEIRNSKAYRDLLSTDFKELIEGGQE